MKHDAIVTLGWQDNSYKQSSARIFINYFDFKRYTQLFSCFSVDFCRLLITFSIILIEISPNKHPILTDDPQGGTLIFSYIRRLCPFFGLKILHFDIFRGFQKNKYLFGYENFVVFLGVMTKLD